MKKTIIMAAATALAVVGCSKNQTQPLPLVEDRTPIVFGATAGVDVTPSKANITVDDDVTETIAVYAFKGGVIVPTTQTSADEAKVGDNLEFTYDATSVYSQATPTLYWPSSGSADAMNFASYFPRQTTGIEADYKLTVDFADQTEGPDYAFAWVKEENVARPAPVAAVELEYAYKTAKFTLQVKKADGDELFGTADGLGLSTEVTTKGIESIKLYSIETATGTQGLKQDYVLNLLTGSVGTGSELANSSAKAIEFKPTAVAKDDIAETLGYVTSTGYLVPVTAANTTDVVVEIVYNDGTEAQTYKGKITKTANLNSGIEAGKHYKFVATLMSSGITFTGSLVDWEEVDMGSTPIELQ